MCRLQEAEEAGEKQSRRTQVMYVKNCQVRDVDKYAQKKNQWWKLPPCAEGPSQTVLRSLATDVS